MSKRPSLQPNSRVSGQADKGEKRALPSHLIILLIALPITVVWIMSSLGIVASAWSVIISIAGTVLGIVATCLPLLSTSPSSSSIHGPDFQTTILEPFSPAWTAYRGIGGIPPSTNALTIQQREKEVTFLYEWLTNHDSSAIVLTGIGGAGKSTLAALTYNYAEEMRLRGLGPFTAPTLWFQIVSAVTMVDLAGTLFEMMEKPFPDFGNLFPHDQAMRLFRLINETDRPRLIILDQFECLLDWQTGKALPNRPGIGEWLDIISSRQCRCRILFTSRSFPLGTHHYSSPYMQEYHVRGLGLVEGRDLLQKRGVYANDEDFQRIIELCDGHVFALTLCASLILKRNIKIPTILKDPIYSRLWTGNIARNFLDTIYKQEMEQMQCEVLLAFSVYREPVPFVAIYPLINSSVVISTISVQFAIDALLVQHLLQAPGGGTYQLHPIVTSYAQEHFVEGDDLANQHALREAHAGAAQYYIQQMAITVPPQGQRRQIGDVHDVLESIWQLCQAENYLEAYNLIMRENIFSDLKRWGGNATLLEFCLLLLPSEHWQPDAFQETSIYNTLADVYWVLGQSEQARIWYERVLFMCKETRDFTQWGWALNNLGRIENTFGNSDQAKIYLEQSLEMLGDVKDRHGQGRGLNNLGWVYYDWGQMKQAQKYFEQALVLFKEIGEQREEGFTYSYLGRIFDDRGQKWLARDYYERALCTLKSAGDRNGEGLMLDNLGRVSYVLGESKKAQEYLEQALKIVREVGDRGGEATVNNDLGMLFAGIEQREQALEYLIRALRIRKEIRNRRGESRVLMDLGDVYLHIENVMQAKEYFQQAMQILQEIGPGWREARAFKKMGNVYNALGEKLQALNYYREALHVSKRIENRWEESRILFKMGIIFIEQNQYGVALAFLLSARQAAEEVKNPGFIVIQTNIDLLIEKMGIELYNQKMKHMNINMNQIIKKVLDEGDLSWIRITEIDSL